MKEVGLFSSHWEVQGLASDDSLASRESQSPEVADGITWQETRNVCVCLVSLLLLRKATMFQSWELHLGDLISFE